MCWSPVQEWQSRASSLVTPHHVRARCSWLAPSWHTQWPLRARWGAASPSQRPASLSWDVVIVVGRGASRSLLGPAGVLVCAFRAVVPAA
jgi:hypothetical protein